MYFLKYFSELDFILVGTVQNTLLVISILVIRLKIGYGSSELRNSEPKSSHTEFPQALKLS